MDPFPYDYGPAMEYSYSGHSLYSSPAVSSPSSYAPSPYDELSAMMSFDLAGYFPHQQPVDHASFGYGTRPIEIPLSTTNNGFHAFTPSPYSSSPGVSSSYMASPAISQASFGPGPVNGVRSRTNTMMSYQVQPMPVMAPDYSMAHAVKAVTAPMPLAAVPPPAVPVQTRRLPQRSHHEKAARSFDCKKCGKLFTRLADVKRHETSVHDPSPTDCPIEGCVRKGTIGFPRRDHLIEHLRTFHNKDIPKRSVNKKQRKPNSNNSML